MSEQATLSPLGEKLQASKAHIMQKDFRGAWDMLQAIRAESGEATPGEQEEMLYQMGVCLNGLEKPAEAINFLSRSLRLAEGAGDLGAQARNLEELGGAHHQRGEFRQGEALYERAHKLYSRLEDQAGIARGFRNLGGVRIDLGHTTQAAQDFATARKMFSEQGDTEGVATCVTNLSLLIYRHKGRAAAIADYEAHLAQNDANHFLVFNNLGFLQLMEEQLEPARQNLKKGVEDCQARKVEDDNIGLLYLNLGVIDILDNQLDSAQEYLDKAAACFAQYPVGKAVLVCALPPEAKEVGRFVVAEDGHKLGVTFLNSAIVAHLRGHKEEAQQLAQKAIELDKEQGYPYAVLGWLFKVNGDAQAAGHAFRRAVSKEPNNPAFKQSLDCTNPYLSQKLGRNEPCPCGSGKKFKKCHGAG
ncbi:MAG: tetratricopeptide repeat protein [Candidatus Eremiobacteraeota bacterium]|nr:tetratricopeptide repeat protein [Candidatus Eremiobacteraeota bacterium]MCW5866533.1 tetratricopeptide repeat protein [Candidatus Eremiobacteraeota bacterium]